MENNLKIREGKWVLPVILLVIVAGLSGFLGGRWQQMAIYQQNIEKIPDINSCH